MFGLQFVNEMENMQREMDQLFRGFGFNAAYGSEAKTVNFKIIDKGESFLVEAALPGLDVKKLNISVLGRHLTVSGEFSRPELPQEARLHCQERSDAKFEKKLQLAANLDTEKIEAEYKQGILKINLPKVVSALPKKIAINVG